MRLKCLEPVILSVEYATDEGRHKCECLKLKCLLQLYLINVHRTVLLFSVLNVCQTRVKTRFGSCSYVTSWNRKTIRTCGKRCISTSTLSNQVLMLSSPCHELCDDNVCLLSQHHSQQFSSCRPAAHTHWQLSLFNLAQCVALYVTSTDSCLLEFNTYYHTVSSYTISLMLL